MPSSSHSNRILLGKSDPDSEGNILQNVSTHTAIHCIPTFRSTTDCIYDSGPIRLQYIIIILTAVLQLPTVFSTVACCTGL